MRHLALPALLVLAGLSQAAADPLPIGETTYIERSLNRSGPLTIEHPPVSRNPYGRRNGSAAEIAGFCRDGGYVRRRDANGHATIIRQREVCDSVAPRTLYPGQVDPRPTWPVEEVRVLRSKG
ncbi:hypothetical protein [Methylobacterium planeticum]|uniref:Uncharacterized protein n=1 Tax=Methylobacterium planeticum TaxID=2615211 RepID=A0A6N6MW61_9HYPH|nr:hypothetical protein [Methylobacterium planeticum]KAB1075019.1 hypothetical protein F6X51_03755 [Methylobacterium planeticum]